MEFRTIKTRMNGLSRTWLNTIAFEARSSFHRNTALTIRPFFSESRTKSLFAAGTIAAASFVMPEIVSGFHGISDSFSLSSVANSDNWGMLVGLGGLAMASGRSKTILSLWKSLGPEESQLKITRALIGDRFVFLGGEEGELCKKVGFKYYLRFRNGGINVIRDYDRDELAKTVKEIRRFFDESSGPAPVRNENNQMSPAWPEKTTEMHTFTTTIKVSKPAFSAGDTVEHSFYGRGLVGEIAGTNISVSFFDEAVGTKQFNVNLLIEKNLMRKLSSEGQDARVSGTENSKPAKNTEIRTLDCRSVVFCRPGDKIESLDLGLGTVIDVSRINDRLSARVDFGGQLSVIDLEKAAKERTAQAVSFISKSISVYDNSRGTGIMTFYKGAHSKPVDLCSSQILPKTLWDDRGQTLSIGNRIFEPALGEGQIMGRVLVVNNIWLCLDFTNGRRIIADPDVLDLGIIDKGLSYEEACNIRAKKKNGFAALPAGFTGSENSINNLMLSALDEFPGFRDAREIGDIPTMADICREYLLSFPSKASNKNIADGPKAFVLFSAHLSGIFNPYKQRIPLPEPFSISHLFNMAVPGLIDPFNPLALQPHEMNANIWDRESIRLRTLLSLYTVEDKKLGSFRNAWFRNDLPRMQALVKKHVIGYESEDRSRWKNNGASAFFIVRGKLGGLFAMKQSPKDDLYSPASLLKMLSPDLFSGLPMAQIKHSYFKNKDAAITSILEKLDKLDKGRFGIFRKKKDWEACALIYEKEVINYVPKKLAGSKSKGASAYYRDHDLGNLLDQPHDYLDAYHSPSALIRLAQPELAEVLTKMFGWKFDRVTTR